MEVSGQLHAQAASPRYPSSMRLGVPQNMSEPFYYYYIIIIITVVHAAYVLTKDSNRSG